MQLTSKEIDEGSIGIAYQERFNETSRQQYHIAHATASQERKVPSIHKLGTIVPTIPRSDTQYWAVILREFSKHIHNREERKI
jgi:hypothetical protein